MDITAFIKGAVDASACDPHASVPLAALSSLLGPLDLYPGIKDFQNRDSTGIEKLREIEPDKKWSSKRVKHYKDRSFNDRSSMEKLKHMLLGAGLGTAAGGAWNAAAGGHDWQPYAAGAIGGSLLGLPVGAARGASRYNSEVVDNPQIFKKPLA